MVNLHPQMLKSKHLNKGVLLSNKWGVLRSLLVPLLPALLKEVRTILLSLFYQSFTERMS